jgi:1-acyl-sn-glycerol-3-phosphate acyltransferase
MRDGYGDPPRTQPRGKRSEGRSVRCRTRPESRLGRAFYGACQQAARVLFITFFGIRADHRERLPRRGGVLVISNHQSFLDPILAAVGMPRPFHPMARETLFRVAPFRWIIRSLYAFPVRPGSADLGAIREALRRLGSGAVVLMFPEGTRTRDGSIGRLQAGPVMLAARGGVPIVPMVIDGAFEAWPRTHLLPWPHRIRVALGEPILLPDDKGLDAEAVMEEIHRRMVELQAELRRGR